MSLVKKSITITDHHDRWVKARVADGTYGSDSEYFRDLVRRDQENYAKIKELKAAIQEGLDSGLSSDSIEDIMARVERRRKDDGRL